MSNSRKAILALIVANVIWGAASPIFKWSLENIQPFTLAFLRFSISSLILLPFAFNSLDIQKKDLLKLICLSIAGISLNIPLFFIGLKYTASINAPIIASAAPIFIILISIPIFREKLKLKKMFGAIVGLIGVCFLFLKPIMENGLDSNSVGNIFLIAATLSGIVHVILTKEMIEKYKANTMIFYSFLIGAITFLPLFVYENYKTSFITNLNIQGLTGILFGIFLSSIVGYYLFYWAIKKLPASEVSLFAYIDPVIAIVIAMPLLGEIPTLTYIFGASLVFLGIYIAEGHLPYQHYKKLVKQ